MTKNQIIEDLYSGKDFNDCIRKMEPEHLRDDLRAEVIATVCEWDEQKIMVLYERGVLIFYVARVITNMLFNKNGPFFKKFRQVRESYVELSQAGDFGGKGDGNNNNRHFAHIVELASGYPELLHEGMIEDRQTREDAEDRLLAGIDSLYWYDAKLIRLYMELGNYRAIEEVTGIPHSSCYKSIKKALNELKTKVL